MTFQPASTLTELWKGEMRGVVVEGRRVLLVHTDDGVRAYADRCAHLGVPLSEGRLEGCTLVCSAHEWCYDVRTGMGINPDGACLKAYPVHIEGDAVLVDVSNDAASPREAEDGEP